MIDFAAEVATLFPLRVIMAILGIPLDDMPLMHRLTKTLSAPNDPDFSSDTARGDSMFDSIPEFTDYFLRVIADRRRPAAQFGIQRLDVRDGGLGPLGDAAEGRARRQTAQQHRPPAEAVDVGDGDERGRSPDDELARHRLEHDAPGPPGRVQVGRDGDRHAGRVGIDDGDVASAASAGFSPRQPAHAGRLASAAGGGRAVAASTSASSVLKTRSGSTPRAAAASRP